MRLRFMLCCLMACGFFAGALFAGDETAVDAGLQADLQKRIEALEKAIADDKAKTEKITGEESKKSWADYLVSREEELARMKMALERCEAGDRERAQASRREAEEFKSISTDILNRAFRAAEHADKLAEPEKYVEEKLAKADEHLKPYLEEMVAKRAEAQKAWMEVVNTCRPNVDNEEIEKAHDKAYEAENIANTYRRPMALCERIALCKTAIAGVAAPSEEIKSKLADLERTREKSIEAGLEQAALETKWRVLDRKSRVLYDEIRNRAREEAKTSPATPKAE